MYVCLIFFLSHCKLLLDLCYSNVCYVYTNKILILLYRNVTLVKLISRELFLYDTLGFNHRSPQVASFYVYQRLTTLKEKNEARKSLISCVCLRGGGGCKVLFGTFKMWNKYKFGFSRRMGWVGPPRDQHMEGFNSFWLHDVNWIIK